MKRILSLLLAFAIMLSLASCSQEVFKEKLGGIHTPSGDLYPEDFLTFDGQSISFSEFRYFYLNYRDMYLAENKDHFLSEENEKALKEEVLQCLLDQWAVRFLAKENHVKLTLKEKKQVKEEVQNTVASYENEEAFEKELATSYASRSYYQSMLEYSSLYFKLFDKLYGEDGKEAFSDEEFYEYFEANYLAVQQIFIPFEEGEKKDSCEKTLAHADSVYQKAKNGENFWSLVETYGKDENMLSYPDGYYFTEGQAEDILYKASKELEIGGISKPVVSSSGVYIIRRMELRKIRMDENRHNALFGYSDSYDEFHSGAYDALFHEMYRQKASEIHIEYSEYWDLVSTKTVY